MVTKKILSYLGLNKKPTKPCKRQHARSKSYSLIKFNLADGTPFETISNVVNISESGLKFTCYELLETNRDINMIVNVAQVNRDVPIKGRLVWTRKSKSQKGVYVVGVEFRDIKDADRQLIRKMVEASSQSRHK
jgi:Tfp pilus assembly protein PilZ